MQSGNGILNSQFSILNSIMNIYWFFQIILGLLGLSLLVFVHELGHFLAAKYCKVRVLTFSIGFGKKLLKITRNGTTYCISAIPFGGYVAMAGEDPEQLRENRPDDFHVQAIWKRALIAIAGPAFNIVFAFFLLTGIYMIGNPEPVSDRLIVGIVEPNSAAEEAGIVGGDTIFTIEGKKANGWEKLREEMAISIGRNITLEIGTQAGRKTVTVIPRELGSLGIGNVGIHPRHRVFVAVPPQENSPAGKAGIKQNDTILSVDGHIVGYYQDMIDIVSASGGREVELVFLRAVGNSVDTSSVAVTPFWNSEVERYMIGVQMGLAQFDELKVVPQPLGTALVMAAHRSYIMGTTVFRYISRIIKGEVKLRAMSGPVGIVQVIGLVWLENLQKAVFLLALISINLGIMNLLPLAVTDGGILLFLLIEKIRGKPLSQKNQARIQRAALAFFITLFLYITFVDLSRGSMLMR
ncbi:MAG: RIP metalloprotease RseP [Fibromonadaceae bacterium]|jgi:regulator of sigma E protease|nr:RIP metalloprotease RseP [Fibromonadaceae bacterium]